MLILIKCWAPDWSEITHATLEVDLKLVESLLARIELANDLKAKQDDSLRFTGLEYDSYDPNFIGLGDPTDIGMTDEMVDGWDFIPAKFEDDLEPLEEGMGSVELMVIAGDNQERGRVYWNGVPKHCGPESKVETYSLHWDDLVKIQEKLESESDG